MWIYRQKCLREVLTQLWEAGKPHCLPFVKLEAQGRLVVPTQVRAPEPRSKDRRRWTAPAQAVWDRPSSAFSGSIQALNRWRVSAHTGEGDLPFSVPTQALPCTPSERRPYQLSAHLGPGKSAHKLNHHSHCSAVRSGHPLPQHWLSLRNGPSLLPWDGWER